MLEGGMNGEYCGWEGGLGDTSVPIIEKRGTSLRIVLKSFLKQVLLLLVPLPT